MGKDNFMNINYAAWRWSSALSDWSDFWKTAVSRWGYGYVTWLDVPKKASKLWQAVFTFIHS